MNATPHHNLKALKIGTAEFSFCRGATTRAETRIRGFRDFDNLMAYTPEITNDREEHEGSYRGLKRVDETFSVKQGLEYLLRGDAFTFDNLTLLLMGEEGSNHTQPALDEEFIEEIEFTSEIPSDSGRWYDLYHDGAHLRALTAVDFVAGAPVAAVGEADDETFTSAGHGLANGDRVVFSGSGLPGGIAAETVYYVKSATSDTFKVSLTLGGSDQLLSADSTNCAFRRLIDTEDYEVDLELGRIRFLTEQSGSVQPIVSGAAITADDETFLRGIDPLSQPSIEGYGRLVIFAQKTEKPFLDHQDFSCTVTAERISENDGKKPSDFQLRVRVTGDTGNVLLAKRAA